MQLLFKRYPTNFLVNLFGHWEEVGQQGRPIPVSGLVYCLCPPTGFMEVVQVPPPQPSPAPTDPTQPNQPRPTNRPTQPNQPTQTNPNDATQPTNATNPNPAKPRPTPRAPANAAAACCACLFLIMKLAFPRKPSLPPKNTVRS